MLYALSACSATALAGCLGETSSGAANTWKCNVSSDRNRKLDHFDVIQTNFKLDGDADLDGSYELHFEGDPEVVERIVLYDPDETELGSSSLNEDGTALLEGPLDPVPTERETYTAVAYDDEQEVERLTLEGVCESN